MIHRTPTLRVLALLSVLLGLSFSATFARTGQPSQIHTPTVPVFEHVTYLPLVLGSDICTTNVYPIVFHKKFLESDPIRVPYPNAPVPMPDPDAAIADIPISARFQLVRDPYEIFGGFSLVRWNGDEASGSPLDLTNALSGTGTLGLGFREKTPPPAGYTNGPNPGVLEAGDWVAVQAGLVANPSAAFDGHIVNKTLMTLPVYDLASGAANNPETSFHIARFVQVRLIGYTVSETTSLEFALVQDNKVCP
jgi:hypothetical protein